MELFESQDLTPLDFCLLDQMFDTAACIVKRKTNSDGTTRDLSTGNAESMEVYGGVLEH